LETSDLADHRLAVEIFQLDFGSLRPDECSTLHNRGYSLPPSHFEHVGAASWSREDTLDFERICALRIRVINR